MVLSSNFRVFGSSVLGTCVSCCLLTVPKSWCFPAEKPWYPSTLSMCASFQAYWAALDKNKSKGEARSGSVDSYDGDQIPSQAMGFLRRGYLNRTLLWLIGDRVTPWTSELYLSLESDAEGQRDEMLEGWNVIPDASLPSLLAGCCTAPQVLLMWLRFPFSTSSANHEFRSMQQN